MVGHDDVGDLFAIHIVKKDVETFIPLINLLRPNDKITIKGLKQGSLTLHAVNFIG